MNTSSSEAGRDLPASGKEKPRERRLLNFRGAIALVIANTIGAGVFTTSGFALADLGDPAFVMLAWLVGGLYALAGVTIYSDLARTYPESGGEYVFLRHCLNPRSVRQRDGFLWSQGSRHQSPRRRLGQSFTYAALSA
jgi:amino acid transporter